MKRTDTEELFQVNLKHGNFTIYPSGMNPKRKNEVSSSHIISNNILVLFI